MVISIQGIWPVNEFDAIYDFLEKEFPLEILLESCFETIEFLQARVQEEKGDKNLMKEVPKRKRDPGDEEIPIMTEEKEVKSTKSSQKLFNSDSSKPKKAPKQGTTY